MDSSFAHKSFLLPRIRRLAFAILRGLVAILDSMFKLRNCMEKYQLTKNAHDGQDGVI